MDNPISSESSREEDLRALKEQIGVLEAQLGEKEKELAGASSKRASPDAVTEIEENLFQRRRYLTELKADYDAISRSPPVVSRAPSVPVKPMAQPKGLAIVIGHSPEGDMGATGLTPPFPGAAKDGKAEYYWNKDLAERIKQRAELRSLRCNIFHRMQNGGPGVREAYRQVALWQPEACVELHFNSYNAVARGTETLYGKSVSIPWAKALQQQMVRLYKRDEDRLDRGLKDAVENGRGAQSLITTVQPSALIEPFFGDNKGDAEIACQLKDGLAEAVVKAFLEFKGITDTVTEPVPVSQPEPTPQPGPAPAPPVVAQPAPSPQPGGSVWDQLRSAYSVAVIDHPHLRGITFAQWALESGKGTSKLAKEHLNFAGMKWRPFMEGLADKVWYEAHDGGEFYCKFASPEKFIAGYWARLDLHPAYNGWRDNAADPEKFFRFIADKWAPPSENPNYVGKVLALYTSLKAENGLPAASALPPSGPDAATSSLRRSMGPAPARVPAELSDEDLWVDRTEDVVATRSASRPSEIEVKRAAAQAKVRWATDENSPDYSHLESTLPTNMQFNFMPEDLELLCKLNDFPIDEAGATPILFGLRGCAIVEGGSANDGAWWEQVVLKDIRPNHQEVRCVLGVWDRAQKVVAVYPGSTVPHAEAVVNWYNTKEAGNLMHTGFYRYTCGDHNGRPGCFLLREKQDLSTRWKVLVRRSSNDLCYEVVDLVHNTAPGNNIHPSFSSSTGWFSSMGCQVIVGSATNAGRHSGPWAKFRGSAGFKDDYGEPGKRFHYLLLTGREALIASQLRREGKAGDPEATKCLRRVRFGSRSDAVGVLNQKLGLDPASKDFGPQTGDLLAAKQKAIANNRSDAVFTPKLDLALSWGVFGPVPADVPVA